MNNWNAGSSKRTNARPCVHNSLSLVATVAPDDVMVSITHVFVQVEVETNSIESSLWKLVSLDVTISLYANRSFVLCIWVWYLISTV